MFWRKSKEQDSESKEGALGRGGFFDTSQNIGVFKDDTISPERIDFILNYAAEKVCKSGMAVPAVMALEISKPVVFIGSQILWGAGPLAAIFVNDRYVNEIALIMEERKNVEDLITRIESIEALKQAEEKLARQEAKQRRADEENERIVAGGAPKRRWWQFGKK